METLKTKRSTEVFDDVIVSKQKSFDPFFTKRLLKDFDVYDLSKSLFDLSKQPIGNNKNILVQLKPTINDVENFHRDFAGSVMSYDEFEDVCREAWKDEHYKIF